MKYNINIKSLLFGSLCLLTAGVSLTSCKDWLEKDPESIVAEDEAFKNFSNFQGYIEEIYSKIPNKININYCSGWNFGDDAVHNPEGYAHIDHQVDLGNYRTWYNNSQFYLNGDRYSLWTSSWYCIRKCNMGIENIGSLVGTDEERDILLGQLYFFRAWWHFELISFFGGLPYIDKAFEASEIPELPRLSFQECANRCAEDFQMAYTLLPKNWDDTLPGMETSGKNDLRVNKFMALCYLGKCYLWAGSPLMKEYEKTKNGGVAQLLGASSNGKTYDYDIEYCKKAAEAFGTALEMVRKKEVPYALAEYKYSNIYDHTPDENSETNFSDIFISVDNWNMPGSTEAIFRGIYPGMYLAKWRYAETFGPKINNVVDGDNVIQHPTGNLVDQYGMANGEPIYLVENGKLVYNEESKWDSLHPYLNRDPRFYHDIVFDGFHYILQTEGVDALQKELEYCPLYTGGTERNIANASSTGYFFQKLVPHQCNEGDKWYDKSMVCYIPYMRLADIYLMYAEAQGAVGGAKSKSTTSTLTAVDAINVLRERVNSDDFPMENVKSRFTSSKEKFLDEVRRERAVELSFEGFRWFDLQRWLLLTEPPYTVKYSHEFERTENDKWYTTNDPKKAKVANFHREDLITRRLDSKHYWFPLPDEDTYLYNGFPQNPGW